MNVDTHIIQTGLESDTSCQVRLTRVESTSYTLSLISLPSATQIDKVPIVLSDLSHDLRILFHDNFITVYIDDAWLYTFHIEEVTYNTNVIVSLIAGQSETITNIVLPELCDWREASYIDLETDGVSAISTVVQERPVEMNPRYDGSLSFWYEPIRETVVPIIKPRQHTRTKSRPNRAASDAIIYYSEVKTLLHSDYRKRFGFATRVYRMPNLEKGAARAAKVLLDKNYREWETEAIDTRPDMRVELGDKISLTYTIPGTSNSRTLLFTADTFQLLINSRNSNMNISGRIIDG